MPWTPMADGARHKVVEQDGKRMRLIDVSDTFVETDWCAKAHVGYVVEGTVELTFVSRIERLVAGDGFILRGDGDDRHKLHAVTPRAVLFVVEDV